MIAGWSLMALGVLVLAQVIRAIRRDYKRHRHSIDLLDQYCYRERNGHEPQSEPSPDRGWKRTPARQSHPRDWDEGN